MRISSSDSKSAFMSIYEQNTIILLSQLRAFIKQRSKTMDFQNLARERSPSLPTMADTSIETIAYSEGYPPRDEENLQPVLNPHKPTVFRYKYKFKPAPRGPLRVYFDCQTPIPDWGFEWDERQKTIFYGQVEHRRAQMRIKLKRDNPTYKWTRYDTTVWYEEYKGKYDGNWVLSHWNPFELTLDERCHNQTKGWFSRAF